MKPETILPEGWDAPLGYANGMLMADGTLHIGGQIGWNARKQFESHDLIDQIEQALSNIARIVESAGGSVTDVGRLTWFVKDKSDYLARQREVGQAYRRVFGKHFPAMSLLIVKDLVEDAALVEIEATAFVGKE